MSIFSNPSTHTLFHQKNYSHESKQANDLINLGGIVFNSLKNCFTFTTLAKKVACTFPVWVSLSSPKNLLSRFENN